MVCSANSRLVSFDTTSRNSNLPLIGFVREYLDAHGVPYRVSLDETGQKANIHAIVGPQAAGGMALSGHVDTVPVDGQAVATQLVPRGDGPHVGVHAPLVAEHLLGLERPRHGHARREHLRAWPVAIACGNTFVLKPSPLDPSPSLFIAELLKKAGLPDGVFNVIQGDRVAVDRLLEHPDVKAISFELNVLVLLGAGLVLGAAGSGLTIRKFLKV